jgi:serine/threonine protein kinase
MVISPKPKTSPFHVLPTPPFSPPEPIQDPSPPAAPKDSYTILRTLHRTQTSHLSLAVASGCRPSTKKAALRHALYAIRTYRLPLSNAALAEREALEVLSMRSLGESPYVQRASRFWDDGQTLFIVLEHCGGGNLLGLIQAEGPVDSGRMKQWACEIVSQVLPPLSGPCSTLVGVGHRVHPQRRRHSQRHPAVDNPLPCKWSYLY